MSFIININKKQDVFKTGYFSFDGVNIYRVPVNLLFPFQVSAYGSLINITTFEIVAINQNGVEISRTSLDPELISLDITKNLYIANAAEYVTELEMYCTFYYEFSNGTETFKSQICQALLTAPTTAPTQQPYAFIFKSGLTREINKTGYQITNIGVFNFDAAKVPAFQFPASGSSLAITEFNVICAGSGVQVGTIDVSAIQLLTAKNLYLCNETFVNTPFEDNGTYYFEIKNGVDTWNSQNFNTYGEQGQIITFDSTEITLDNTQITFDIDY